MGRGKRDAFLTHVPLCSQPGCCTVAQQFPKGDAEIRVLRPAKINATAHLVRQRDKSADDAAETEIVSLTACERGQEGGNLSLFIGDPRSRDDRWIVIDNFMHVCPPFRR